MANFMTAEEAINKIEDGSDLSDLSDEEDLLFHTDIGNEEDLLSELNMEDDNNDDDNDGDMWSAWTSGNSDLPKFAFSVPNPGIHFPQSPNQERDALQCFLTDELLEEFVTATNAYASMKLHGKKFSNNSIWHRWQDVTLPEFKAYLGVILNIAINDKPDIKTFFSCKWLEAQPFFVSIFSRRRFLQIYWMLHLKAPQPSTV